MAWVTLEYLERWATRRFTGRYKPETVVQIRRGNYRHDWWDGPRIRNVEIPGETAAKPWYPRFVETTPWVTVPNVASCEITKDYEQKGTVVATIGVDNIAYVRQTGPLGHIYHLIKHGWFSPTRGFRPPTRPRQLAGRAAEFGTIPVEENEWRGVLTEQANIRIWQGFGDPELVDGEMPEDGGPNGAWVFNGFIDRVEPDSAPPTLTINARAGKQLTDQRIYGYNKSKQLHDPVTFIDENEADNLELVGVIPDASSDDNTGLHLVKNILTKGTDTEWRSAEHGDDTVTEWCEVHVPEGRYEDFILDAPAGMEVYVGVFARKRSKGRQIQMDDKNLGFAVDAGFWIDGHMGEVPGAFGGWEFIHKIDATEGGRQTYSLGHKVEIGNNSVIRLGFRDLAPVPAGGTGFAARVFEFKPRKRRLTEEARDGKWIRVKDISDMVRVALRWAGFTEWEVENTGTRLPGKVMFHRSNFLIDIIDKAKENTGMVFFLADPDTGESFGIPTFRKGAQVSRDVPVVAELTDYDFLTDFTPQLDEAPRAYIIRVRGKEASKRKGGRTLDGDPVRRLYASYRPPWTRDNLMAGIVKHVTYQNPAIRSISGCKWACYLIALEEALEASKAQGEIPANINIELDDQVGVSDEGSGTNMRWYLSQITSTWQNTNGERSHKMSLGGALIDSEYVTGVLEDIEADATGDAVSGAGEIGEYPRNPMTTKPRDPRIR